MSLLEQLLRDARLGEAGARERLRHELAGRLAPLVRRSGRTGDGSPVAGFTPRGTSPARLAEELVGRLTDARTRECRPETLGD